jgi:hypothetical protein
VISRVIVILLAFGAAIYRASQGAFVEATGLAALGGGLLLLRLARQRASFRNAAVGCFLITAASIAIVIIRDYL